MTYLYAAVCFLAGLILIARMGKENRVFCLLGAFFLFLGAWWVADALTGADLFAGVYVWILRGVTAAVLIPACVVFFRQKKLDRGDFQDPEDRK